MISRKIVPANMEDIASIYEILEQATALKMQKTGKTWKGFERSLIEKEITEHRQWKIMEGEEVACIFITVFSDPLIWQERDRNDAIYIHRIATHSLFRGRGYVKDIVMWVKQLAAIYNKRYVRLDTYGGNEQLNNHYIHSGFSYLGQSGIKSTAGLPAHYVLDESFSLFEITI